MSPRSIEQLEKCLRSRWFPLRARQAVGQVLARAQDIRDDDGQMLDHLLREWSYTRASIERIEEAVRGALWIADYDLRARASAPSSAPA